ncbi:AHH domain-containing protein [Cohnella herbarum]|uniref:Uncharacterized protein n=1 Tax=Cohnella herbarum TaxID=2728023 RepID=A0A7Z2VGH5_9BACL|nr:AHH domain-containing protein [Cohnella herbarum]QJD82591.1 hypothetical protein HH215_04880 [Cohnella herbarum]
MTGIEKPAGWHAHHIVAFNHSNEFADIHLDKKYQIDFNSSANGVYLPKMPGQSKVVIDGQTLATHNVEHTNEYFRYVYNAIKAGEITGKDGILKAFEEFRNVLLKGKLSIGNL